MIRTVLGAAALLTTAAVVPASAAAAPAHHPTHPAHRHVACARQFEKAVQAYLDTTQRHDAADFEKLLSPDYTVILPGGTTFVGKKDGAAFIDRFFARTDWTQTFTETSRAVEGCRTALVVFDSVYSDEDGPAPLVIALTWTYRDGRWFVLTDQNTVRDPS